MQNFLMWKDSYDLYLTIYKKKCAWNCTTEVKIAVIVIDLKCNVGTLKLFFKLFYHYLSQ